MRYTREQIMEELKSILLSEYRSNTAAIESCSEDTRLAEDLGFTSISILYMVVAIEESFDIVFSDVGMSDFKTLKNVVDYIEAKLK